MIGGSLSTGVVLVAIVNAKVGARASYTVVRGMELELALRWLALVPMGDGVQDGCC